MASGIQDHLVFHMALLPIIQKSHRKEQVLLAVQLATVASRMGLMCF